MQNFIETLKFYRNGHIPWLTGNWSFAVFVLCFSVVCGSSGSINLRRLCWCFPAVSSPVWRSVQTVSCQHCPPMGQWWVLSSYISGHQSSHMILILPFGIIIDWLIDWSIDWLIDWLIDFWQIWPNLTWQNFGRIWRILARSCTAARLFTADSPENNLGLSSSEWFDSFVSGSNIITLHPIPRQKDATFILVITLANVHKCC